MMCELSNGTTQNKKKIVAKSAESEMYHLASGKFSAIIHASYFKWPNFNDKDNYVYMCVCCLPNIILLYWC